MNEQTIEHLEKYKLGEWQDIHNHPEFTPLVAKILLEFDALKQEVENLKAQLETSAP